MHHVYIMSYALYKIMVNSTSLLFITTILLHWFCQPAGDGTLCNSCIQKTSWANCFQTRPILQHDPAVHPMQDLAFTHWLSINVPTWAAIFISCSCEGDQPQWPSNRHHPQRGLAGGLNLPQLVDNLTDHLTDHPIYIYSPISMSIILQCACVYMCMYSITGSVHVCLTYNYTDCIKKKTFYLSEAIYSYII